MTTISASPPFRSCSEVTADISSRHRQDDRLAALILYTPLLATTFLAKLSVPPFAAQSLSIAYLFIGLAIGLGLALGYLQINICRLSFFLLFIGYIGLVQVLRDEPFSPGSMLLLATLYVAYAFSLPGRRISTERALDYFLGMAICLALAGIAQYAVQFAFGQRYAFPIENFVPNAFVVQGFHALAPIAYGETTYRVNGLFFAEPSFFSQFMAVAIVVELLGRNRMPLVALLGLALLLSYSGTGVLILAICGPLILITRRQARLLWMSLFGLVLVAALGSYLDVDKLIGRVGEFDSVHSSAYARFVGGFDLFERYLWPEPMKVLFGFGAGQFPDYSIRMPFPVAEMSLFKMIFEYGIIGAGIYFAFVFYCISRSTAPAIVRLAITLTLLLNGPFVPFFHGLALSLLVWTSNTDDAEASTRVPQPMTADGA